MSHSETKTSWPLLMKSYFNVEISDSEAVVWFCELRATVKGWKHTGGGDPIKGEEAKRINNEICDAIRHISEMDHIPRKNEGSKKDYHGKPNVKDLRLWIWIYHNETGRNRGSEGSCADMAYVNCATRTIRKLIQEGRLVHAAIVATGDPMAYCDSNELGCNRGPTPEEDRLIAKFCNEIGFNPHIVL